jgi:hypothetical protein
LELNRVEPNVGTLWMYSASNDVAHVSPNSYL